MKSTQAARLENQVYSSRVARSEFDKNWETLPPSGGYVTYVATKDKAKVVVLLTNGEQKLLIFKKGGTIMVGGGGTSHYSKPHLAKNI
jgi:hypothetical protein